MENVIFEHNQKLITIEEEVYATIENLALIEGQLSFFSEFLDELENEEYLYSDDKKKLEAIHFLILNRLGQAIKNQRDISKLLHK